MTDQNPTYTAPSAPPWLMPLVLAGAFLCWSYWLHASVLGKSDVLLGDPGSDVLRGLWTLHHTATQGLFALWTDRVFYPVGAFLLPLPLVTSAILSPFFWFASPIAAYNIAIPTLLAINALAAAWLCREWTDRWWPGAIAGIAVCSQPLLLHAVGDGTPEHIALWPLLAAAAAGIRTLRTGKREWGLATVLLLVTVALDSPYFVVFGTLLLPLIWAPSLISTVRSRRFKALGYAHWPALLGLFCGALFVHWLYSGFSLTAPTGGLDHDTAVSGNSAQLRNWWQFIYAAPNEVLGNLVPAYLPQVFLVGGLALSLCAPVKNAPWLIASVITLVLSLGVNTENPATLEFWWGESGRGMGNTIVAFNEAVLQLPMFEHIRFPRRWLVITGICLGQGAACGLNSLAQRIIKRVRPAYRPSVFAAPVGAIVALVLTHHAIGAANTYRSDIPNFDVPQIEFTTWLATQPGDGAVILFPTLRKAEGKISREERTVFANLSSALAGGDKTFLQVLHDRPVYSYPGLQTLAPLGSRISDLHRTIRELDDLTGVKEVPARTLNRLNNTYDRKTIDTAIQTMQTTGIRWLVFDRAVYNQVPLGFIEALFKDVTRSRHTFDDGDGVLILELNTETAP